MAPSLHARYPLHRYHEPLRLPAEPPLIACSGCDPAQPGLPCCALRLARMLRQIPRQTTGRSSVDCSRPVQRPSPNSCRVGVCSNSLGTCSGFTRVAACVLAQPPFRGLLSRGFENHGRLGTVTSPDSYRGASTIPRAGLAPAGEVHLHGAQEIQWHPPEYLRVSQPQSIAGFSRKATGEWSESRPE